MLGTLLRFASLVARADIRRTISHAKTTAMLAAIGGLLGLIALIIGLIALIIWLEQRYGVFAALGIVGGAFAVLAIILLVLAFARPNGRSRPALAGDRLAAVAGTGGADAIAGAGEAVKGAVRKSPMTVLLVAATLGWVLGRRL